MILEKLIINQTTDGSLNMNKLCIKCDKQHNNRKYCSHPCYWQDRKDKRMLPPSRKGIKFTPKQRAKRSKIISQIKKAGFESGKYKPTRYWLGKKRKDMEKENHWNWKGGFVKHPDKRIRRSGEYKEWRVKVYERDNYACRVCGDRGISIVADHIKPFVLFPELRFVVKNGRTLCENCHKNTPTYGRKKEALERMFL